MGKLQTKLSKFLGERRLSQREFADMAGLQPRTVNVIYNDKWSQIHRSTIEKVCNALEITTGELFELVEENQEE